MRARRQGWSVAGMIMQAVRDQIAAAAALGSLETAAENNTIHKVSAECTGETHLAEGDSPSSITLLLGAVETMEHRQ